MNVTKLAGLSGNSSLRRGSDFIAASLAFFWILFHFRVKTHYLPVRVESTHGWRKPLGSGPLRPSRTWWTGAGVTYKLPHRCGHWGCRGGERRRRAGGSEGGVPGFFFFTSKCMQLSSVSLAFLNRTGFACVHAYAQMCAVSPGKQAECIFQAAFWDPSPHISLCHCNKTLGRNGWCSLCKSWQNVPKEKKKKQIHRIPFCCSGSNSFFGRHLVLVKPFQLQSVHSKHALFLSPISLFYFTDDALMLQITFSSFWFFRIQVFHLEDTCSVSSPLLNNLGGRKCGDAISDCSKTLSY